MPMAFSVEKLNGVLTAEAIRARLAEDPEVLDRLRSPDEVLTLARELGGLTNDELVYLGDIPVTLVHGIRAAVDDEECAIWDSCAGCFPARARRSSSLRGVSRRVGACASP